MNKNKLSIKDILWVLPMIVGVTIVSIIWFPVAVYKSFKHSSNNKK